MPICPQCYAELGWYIVVCPHCGSNVQPSKEDEPADESAAGSEAWKMWLPVAFGLAVAVVATILKIDRFLVLLLFWASVLVALAAGYAAWAWIRHRKEKKGRR